MFLFALKMCVADLKVILRKFWWLGLLFLAIIVFMPFHNMYMHALLYFVMMTIGLFVPRYSKIQFILPVDEKQIKRFLLIFGHHGAKIVHIWIKMYLKIRR